MEGTPSSGGGNNSAVIAVLVLIVVVAVGFFAYKQGYFSGKDAEKPDIQINLPGGSGSPSPTN